MGEFWTVKKESNWVVNIVSSAPLMVQYYKATQRHENRFVHFDDSQYDINLNDLNQKISNPKTVLVGRRTFYEFEL